jgi:hypothetical protein
MALSRRLHSVLLILGGALIFASSIGRVEVWEGEVVVPPNDFIDWSLSPFLGSRINVVAEVEMESNNTGDAVLLIIVMDEGEFSKYAGEELDPLLLPPLQRIVVEADRSTTLRHLVLSRSGRHVVLSNKQGVSHMNQEKPTQVHIFVTDPYGFLLYIGVPLLIFGLAIIIRRRTASADEA